jgi:succinyl-diaminopimelate desuccinylase
LATEKNSFDERESLHLLRQAIRIDTSNPPGREGRLAEFFGECLKAQGINTKIVDLGGGRSNIMAKLAGKWPGDALLYTGHLDTVPLGSAGWKHDPFAGIEQDGKIYGLGAADMKSGFAAMVMAMINLKLHGRKPARDLLLLGTAGEEVDFLGSRAFVQDGGMGRVGAVIIGEPSNGDVITAQKGSLTIVVTTRGRSAHGSLPEKGVNAISKMVCYLAALQDSAPLWSIGPDPLLGKPTFSANRIEGGIADNVVPDSCRCRIEVRLIPGMDKRMTLQPFFDMMHRLQEQDPAFDAEISDYYYLPTIEPPEDASLTDLALEIAHHASGKAAEVRGFSCCSDASILISGKGVPVLIYGPGNESAAHRTDENVEIEKYLAAVRFYMEFAERYV